MTRAILGRMRFFSALFALFSLPAMADAPVSVGTAGALERAALTQGTARKGTAASFGTPAYNEDRSFGLRLRIPLYVSGAEANNAVSYVPFAVKPARQIRALSGALPFESGVAAEDLTAITSYIPAVEFGDERKAVHFQAGALSLRLGHGSLVHYFTNSPEGGDRKFGFLGEFNSASLGAQLTMGDVTAPGNFVGGRVYGRPILWFVSPDSLLHPNDLDLDPRTEAAGIWVTGLTAAVDGFAPVDGDSRSLVYSVGWDHEAALLDNKLLRAIGYVDFNLLGGGQHSNLITAARDGVWGELPFGVGAHPGLRLNLDLPIAMDIEMEAEYNIGSEGYVPRYFDRLYFLERSAALGVGSSKAGLAAPASHGYNLRAGANILKTVSLFLEARDQFPFQLDRGTNSGMVTAGASFFFLFFGGGATISQAGMLDYDPTGLFGAGFIFSAEGRVALFANIMHIVARYYRVHDPVDITLQSRDFETIEGAIVGLEINLDFNVPIPL